MPHPRLVATGRWHNTSATLIGLITSVNHLKRSVPQYVICTFRAFSSNSGMEGPEHSAWDLVCERLPLYDLLTAREGCRTLRAAGARHVKVVVCRLDKHAARAGARGRGRLVEAIGCASAAAVRAALATFPAARALRISTAGPGGAKPRCPADILFRCTNETRLRAAAAAAAAAAAGPRARGGRTARAAAAGALLAALAEALPRGFAVALGPLSGAGASADAGAAILLAGAAGLPPMSELVLVDAPFDMGPAAWGAAPPAAERLTVSLLREPMPGAPPRIMPMETLSGAVAAAVHLQGLRHLSLVTHQIKTYWVSKDFETIAAGLPALESLSIKAAGGHAALEHVGRLSALASLTRLEVAKLDGVVSRAIQGELLWEHMRDGFGAPPPPPPPSLARVSISVHHASDQLLAWLGAWAASGAALRAVALEVRTAGMASPAGWRALGAGFSAPRPAAAGGGTAPRPALRLRWDGEDLGAGGITLGFDGFDATINAAAAAVGVGLRGAATRLEVCNVHVAPAALADLLMPLVGLEELQLASVILSAGDSAGAAAGDGEGEGGREAGGGGGGAAQGGLLRLLAARAPRLRRLSMSLLPPRNRAFAPAAFAAAVAFAAADDGGVAALVEGCPRLEALDLAEDEMWWGSNSEDDDDDDDEDDASDDMDEDEDDDEGGASDEMGVEGDMDEDEDGDGDEVGDDVQRDHGADSISSGDVPSEGGAPPPPATAADVVTVTDAGRGAAAAAGVALRIDCGGGWVRAWGGRRRGRRARRAGCGLRRRGRPRGAAPHGAGPPFGLSRAGAARAPRGARRGQMRPLLSGRPSLCFGALEG
ncbi:MAG: hypothetical protein J3K34DRAFT_457363 [Monoraphidium minutum]|nr:MAG: hypothetical protein J3K34DRAFT_457363 [Monoraphidium minutum]